MAQQAQLAITFDDLPFVDIDHQQIDTASNQVTHLAKILTKKKIPALGFVNESGLYHAGQLQEKRRAILTRWVASGLELGNHTYSHVSLNRVSLAQFKNEILRGENISRTISQQHGRPFRYFRHPYLHVGADLKTRHQVETFLRQHNYSVAPVTVNNSDWIFALAYEQALTSSNPQLRQRVVASYLDHLEASLHYAEQLSFELFGHNISQVLLLHVNALNTDNIEQVLQRIEQRGYRFISLEKALSDPAYRTPDTYAGQQNDSWLHHWAITAGLRPDREPTVPRFIRKLAGPRSQKKY